MKKKKILTQEQIDYRKNLFKKSISPIKQSDSAPSAALTDDDKISQCFYYLNNCVFWINEYIDGNIDKNKLLETALAIQNNGKKLEKLMQEHLTSADFLEPKP